VKLDVIAFGAHPDDVEIGCGGTIIKLEALGYTTGVVALTRGEMGTRGSAEIRAREFAAAARVLGVSVHKTLDMPDGRVEPNWENKVKVIREIRAHQPRVVFAPYWVARHPDHEAASRPRIELPFRFEEARYRTGSPSTVQGTFLPVAFRVLSIVRFRHLQLSRKETRSHQVL